MPSKQPSNQYVISAQLDKTSFDKLHELMQASGFNKSKMIRVLIMGAQVRHSQSVTIRKASNKEHDE